MKNLIKLGKLKFIQFLEYLLRVDVCVYDARYKPTETELRHLRYIRKTIISAFHARQRDKTLLTSLWHWDSLLKNHLVN